MTFLQTVLLNDHDTWGEGLPSVPSENDEECIVTLAIRKDFDNQWLMTLTTHSGGSEVRSRISDEFMSTMLTHGYHEQCLGKGGAVAKKLDGPIVLLRRRIDEKKTSAWNSREKPLPGIMLWLEAVP